METWFWILGWFLSLLTITWNKLTIFLGSFTADEISAPKPAPAIIVSLAVADFCVVVERNSFSIFLRHYGKNAYYWPEHLLSWVSFIRWLFSNTSVGNLHSLELDRLIAIVYPLKCIVLIYDSSTNYPLAIFFFWTITFGFVVFRFSFRFSLKTIPVTAPFNFLYVISLEILPCALIIASFVSMSFHVGKHDRSSTHK